MGRSRRAFSPLQLVARKQVFAEGIQQRKQLTPRQAQLLMHGKAVEPFDLRVSDVAIGSNAYVLRSTRLAPIAKDRNSNGTSGIVSSPSAVVNGGFRVERPQGNGRNRPPRPAWGNPTARRRPA